MKIILGIMSQNSTIFNLMIKVYNCAIFHGPVIFALFLEDCLMYENDTWDNESA